MIDLSPIIVVLFAAIVGAFSYTVNGETQQTEPNFIIPEILYVAIDRMRFGALRRTWYQSGSSGRD